MLNVDSLLSCAEANSWTQLRNGFNDRKLPANAYGDGNNGGSKSGSKSEPIKFVEPPIEPQFPIELSTPAQLLPGTFMRDASAWQPVLGTA